ncbi:MAG: hypothetical protein O7G86_03735 [Gammaproteobacteria bacterium]|nr:hypothetical protein [Gammaproteobacteria bacterium]MCZ6853010.1 hypothetical protein [Gammaproteobacteria bacterium]
MNQSDPLELVKPGSLAPPGPVGRLVRLGLGVMCLMGLWNVTVNLGTLITEPIAVVTDPYFIFLIVLGFWIFNYVVNIGFSKSWGRRPAYVSLAGFLILGVVGFVMYGSYSSPLLGAPLFLWLSYFYGHLGLSFVLAAALATPGCEMRAIPELVGLVTGRAAEEHQCPASFLTRLDEWEQKRMAA